MEQSRTYFDLLEACSKPGCPVCRVVLDAVDHAIDVMNYEFVNDPAVRTEIESAWGFCNTHAHQWLSAAQPLGTALIYDAVLGTISDLVEAIQPNPKTGVFASRAARMKGSSATRLAPSRTCSLCAYRDEQERLVTSALLVGMKNTDFRVSYESSAGVCIPHLRAAISACDDPLAFKVLRQRALEEAQRLRGHLKEIARKHDYRFQHEPAGEERGANERAVRQVAGVPGIVDRP